MRNSHLLFLLAMGLAALPACQGWRARAQADEFDPTSRRLANDKLLAISRLPEAPSGLFMTHAAGDDRDVTFYWNAVPGASSYGFYLGINHDPDPIVDVVGTSFSRKVEPGTTYYWRVAALNAQGLMRSELRSFTTSGANPCGILAKPENLQIVNVQSSGSRRIYELEWTRVEHATNYLIEEAAENDPDFDEARGMVTLNGQTSVTFEHTVTEATSFFYRVRALRIIEGFCSIDGPPSKSFGFGLVGEKSDEAE